MITTKDPCCQTGLREGNIVGLLVSQVDFHADRINIQSESMKDAAPLTIKMTSSVKNTLVHVLKSWKIISPYVFTDDRGNPYSSNGVSMAFRRACKRAGVEDLRFHDLRHDFATLLISNNVDLYRVQHLLGHKDMRMTQRYAHLLPENCNAIDAIEGKGFVTILSQSGKLDSLSRWARWSGFLIKRPRPHRKAGEIDGPITIGRDGWYDRWFFKGAIDDIRIYNRDIS